MKLRKKLEKGLRHLAVAVIIASVAGFLFLRWQQAHNTVSPPVKKQAGYNADDRHKLDQLIHEGAKDD